MSSSDNNTASTWKTQWQAFWMLLSASLRHNRSSFGLVATVGSALLVPLMLSIIIPTYTYSAGVRIFNDTLQTQLQQTNRSPLTLLFRHLRGNTSASWPAIASADTLMSQYAVSYLQLPIAQYSTHLRTTPLSVFYAQDQQQSETLGSATIGSLSNVESLMHLNAGHFATATQAQDRTIECMISRTYAYTYGLAVGDTLVVSNRDGTASLTLRVVGIWSAIDATDVRWMYAPDAFDTVLLVADTHMTTTVATAFPDSVGQATWYILPSVTTLSPTQVNQLDTRIREIAQELSKVPAQLERSPLEPFHDALTQIETLTPQITLVALPMMLFAGVFIMQTATINARRRREEFALLHSRGIAPLTLITLGIGEWLFIVVSAGILSIPLSMWVAQLMLRTVSFLQFDTTLDAGILIPPSAWTTFAITLCALVILGIPALVRTSRNNLISVFQHRQSTRIPRWVLWLFEGVLVAVVIYGHNQLPQQVATNTSNYANPLLLALPILNTILGAVIANHISTVMVHVLAWLSSYRPDIVPFLLLRTLGRRPERMRTPIFLLSLTIGMGGYLASYAATIDDSTKAAIAYRMGATTHIIEAAPMAAKQSDLDTERYLIAPLGMHYQLPGVTHATLVSQLDGQIELNGQTVAVKLTGIDRDQFAAAVPSFTDTWLGNQSSMGALLNQLALNRTGLIVSSTIATPEQIGNRVRISMSIDDIQVDTTGTIVAVVDGWPGAYPQDGGFVISNRAFMADTLGFDVPADVWLVREGADINAVWQRIHELGIPAIQVIDQHEMWIQEAKQPDRQGIFSMLTLSFMVTFGLALLALIVSVMADIQRRLVETGILRALGLSARDTQYVLVAEHASVLSIGIFSGIILSIVNTQTLLPYVVSGIAPHFNTPPTVPIIAYQSLTTIVIGFAATFAVLLVFMVQSTARVSIVERITLNQTFD